MAIQSRLTAREGRRFAFTVGAAFVVLGALSAWRGHQWPPRVLWVGGGTLLLAGVVVPGRLSGVHRAWMGLAHAISKVTAPIVVGAMYFLIITPVGALLRLMGRNPLRHRERDGGFWITAPSDGRSDLDNLF